MRRRGFSVIELLFAVGLMALIVGLSLVSMRRPKEGAESRSVAEAVAEELRLARLSAISRHIPVAVGFPSANGSRAVSQGLYVLEGEVNPRLTRSIRYSGDFPGAFIAQAFWPLDSARMHNPGLGNNTAQVQSNSSSDNLVVSTWAPTAYRRDTLFVFTPSGAIRTNGAVHFDGSYHVLVTQGLTSAAGTPPGGGALAYCQPSLVCQPYTVNISLSGQITVTAGVTAGTVNDLATRIPTPAGPNPPTLTIPTNAPPTILAVDLAPSTSDTLPGGIDLLVGLDQYVTLRTRASDPNGDSLYCVWEASGNQGTFSSATQDRMEWDPAQNCWVSVWEWRPDSTMSLDDQVVLTCRVRDRSQAASAAVSTGARTIRLGQRGRVVYTSYNIDYWGDVGMVNLDGTGERLLTNTPEQDELDPSYSPDGKRIAYGVWDSDTWSVDVWVMNYDGTGAYQLTNTPDLDEWPPYEWSPDGTRLAFSADDWITGDSGIFVLSADGSNSTRVSPTNSNLYFWGPTWSRDGQALVYEGDDGLYWSNVRTGAPPIRILYADPDNVWVYDCDWSPSSNTLAYIRSDWVDDEVYLIDVVPGTGATSNHRPLFSPRRTSTWEWGPAWSASGLLAMESDGNIIVAPASGTPITNITNGSNYSYGPAWTPQGNLIFASDMSNKPNDFWDLYHAAPDGSWLRRLTSNDGDNYVTRQPASTR
ncbi:MAG: hypothetical protein AMXMBFR33_23130 [Candidatus Xenobia bacterium]|jgi:Tol biopolymer transport system component/type II secretory pathway pseudopilin PulG